MIKSFRCKETKKVFKRQILKETAFKHSSTGTLIKVHMIDAPKIIADLKYSCRFP